MTNLLIVLIAQVVFSFSRTLNVRYTAIGNIPMAVATGVLVKAFWLVGSAIGISSFTTGDYTTAAAYVAGGVLGDWLSFKINTK